MPRRSRSTRCPTRLPIVDTVSEPFTRHLSPTSFGRGLTRNCIPLGPRHAETHLLTAARAGRDGLLSRRRRLFFLPTCFRCFPACVGQTRLGNGR